MFKHGCTAALVRCRRHSHTILLTCSRCRLFLNSLGYHHIACGLHPFLHQVYIDFVAFRY